VNPITEKEIQRSLERVKGASAPGEDGLPMPVWMKIWPYTSTAITNFFKTATTLGHHPRAWRRAVIVVLRKPEKPDYTIPNAYRPISLLDTLGKPLESVMASRLTHYAEDITFCQAPNSEDAQEGPRNRRFSSSLRP